MVHPLGHVQRGKAADTGDQVPQQHQKRVMYTVKYDLPVFWLRGHEMQTRPLHSMPHHGHFASAKRALVNAKEYRVRGWRASDSGTLVLMILALAQ
ncbi:hypothetical protein D3C81_1107870 [compost metagenome]